MAEYTKGAWSGSTATATVQFQGAFSTTFSWASAAVANSRTGAVTIASTTADVVPGDLVIVDLGIASSVVIQGAHRLSTAAASRVTVVIENTSSTDTSTLSGTGRITWVKLGNS